MCLGSFGGRGKGGAGGQPSIARPSSVRYPHVGNSKRPFTCSYSLSCHGREPSADKVDQQLDTESVGQYQCFGTATRLGPIEHVEQAALVCAKRCQVPNHPL